MFYTYKITVYNRNQKLGLIDCYKEWQDGGYMSVDSYEKNKRKKSITYKIAFRFKANLNGCLSLYFDNLKNRSFNYPSNFKF